MECGNEFPVESELDVLKLAAPFNTVNELTPSSAALPEEYLEALFSH